MLTLVTAASFLTAQEMVSTPAFATPRPPEYMARFQPNQPPVTDLVFEQQPGPDTPTLHTLAEGAAGDEEILARVVAWYDENRETLRALWREDDDTRLAALYAMYLVHISHVYGETPAWDQSVTSYLSLERSHCGLYTVVQHQILDAMGIPWRQVGLDNGWHGWIEVPVNGTWEIFDATVNVWISRSGYELDAGVAREYRYFYTPLLDIDRPDARLHLGEGYNMHNLRAWMPGLGLFYIPPAALYLQDSSENV
jgi:hypothetical protein